MTETMTKNEEGGLSIYRFEELTKFSGLAHFISSRRGGVSPAPFASLNLSLTVGDSAEAVAENRSRLLARLGLKEKTLVAATLVHGDDVLRVEADGKKVGWCSADAPADALITRVRGIALSVLTADCVPIFFYDPVRAVAGIAHAGRLGTMKRICERVVARFSTEFGTKPSDLHLALGPSIDSGNYSVSDEFAEVALAQLGECKSLVQRSNRNWYFDLWEANRSQAIGAGVAPDRIRISGISTFESTNEFFSERRQKPTGRFASGIMLV